MAILNGFGRSLGDSIVGLQALHVALDRGDIPPSPVLFRLPDLPPAVQALYAAATFCECRALDWSLATPDQPFPGGSELFVSILDLRDFAFDPAFRGMAMIDYFLRRLRIDPTKVAPEHRRNTWVSPHIRPTTPPLPAGYVLVCPHASMPLRDMPEPVHAAVLARLRALGITAATQGAVPAGMAAVAVPQSASLPELCGWVAAARLVVTTDTAMVHLADAFAVPSIAVFTTHRPEWRARDYPLCHALYRPAAGLPPALEFSRGPEDLAAAQAAWLDAAWLDGGGVRWLTDAVAEGVRDVRSGWT